MKKTLLSFIILTSFGMYSTQAQIILNDTHIIGVGDDVVVAHDTIPTGVSIGPSGASQTWNFLTVLDEDGLDTLKFRNPSGYPGNTNYPLANVVMTDTQEDSVWMYLTKNTTGLFVTGRSQYVSGQLINFPITATIAVFPSTMGTGGSTNWNGTILGLDVSPYPLGLDSIKINRASYVNSNVDGWGTVTTPFASAGFNALRQITYQEDADTTWEKSTATGMWSIVSPATIAAAALINITLTDFSFDTTRTAKWWTDNPSSKFPVVEMDYEANGDVNYVDWQKSSPTLSVNEQVKTVTGVSLYPNPATSEITIETSLTDNNNIKISDVTGKLISNNSFKTTKITLSVLDFDPGIYFYSIYDVNGKDLYSSKFIVAK